MKNKHTDVSLSEVNASVSTNVKGNFLRRLFPFMGPAYLVSVGYMDPGNWATDIAGGSKFGYALIWVLLMSNLMALLLQSLSARLGVVAQRDLAQASRSMYGGGVNIFLYILAEVAIAACDLAEVVGMAIGLQLLFGIPLIWGVAICVLDAFILLFLINLGIRKLEAFIIGLISIIGLAFLAQMILAKPDISDIAAGIVPSLPGKEALYLAIGIIGATVMPHNLYLHSALVQTRKVERNPESIWKAIRFNFIDSAIALNLALFVNAAILILAASVFFTNGYNDVVDIRDAHKLLTPLLGSGFAPMLFAIALIASGQSSTITGTLAGQIVMEGYLHLRIQPWVRRIITRLLAVIPAVIVIWVYGEESSGDLLVFSQVVLSLQLGFAIIPLIHYVSDSKRMGQFVIGWKLKLLAWLCAAIIVYLNVNLVFSQAAIWVSTQGPGNWALRYLVIPFFIFSGIMLLYIIVKPLFFRKEEKVAVPHSIFRQVSEVSAKKYRRIAVALDFSPVDQHTLQHAMSIGGKEGTYLLIHTVETAGALVLGQEIEDFETTSDLAMLDQYAKNLADMGYQCETFLSYGNPKKAIPETVRRNAAELLIMGAHGHKGLKDLIFGTTVDAVRHAVDIPVMIVPKNM
jgi:manganese transport protein